MHAETDYLIRHALLHDSESRMRAGDDPAKHAWAVEFMKTTLLSDNELERHAAEMARHARLAQHTGSPASQRVMKELELHFLNVAYRRALNESRVPEALVLAERLVAHDDAAPRDRADALTKTSAALRLDHRFDEAIAFAQRAFEVAVDSAQQAWAQQELANAYSMARKIEEADEAYGKALQAAQDLHDTRLETSALCNLGSIRRQQGRGDEALILFRRAIEVGREAGARDYEGTAHLQLGYLLGMQGKVAEAESELKLAIDVLAGTAKAMFRVDACSHLGDLAMRGGDFETAGRYVELAMSIARELGYRAGLAQALNFAAMLHDEIGRTDAALDFLRKSIEIAREAGDIMNVSYGLVNLGAALQRNDRLEQAEQAFEQAEQAAQQARNPYTEAGAVGGIGDIRRKQGRLMEAWTKFEHAAHLMDMAGYPPGVVRMRIKLAGIDAESGDAAKACGALTELRDRAEELGSREDYENACIELARAYEKLSQWQPAAEAWQQALDAAPGAPARHALLASLRHAQQKAAESPNDE